MTNDKYSINILRFLAVMTFALSNVNFIYAQNSITIIFPNPITNGGIVWDAGTNPVITWTSSGISNVDIDISINGGLNWKNIGLGLAASLGIYSSWTVPDTPSTQLVIRVKESGVSLSSQNSKFVFIKSPQWTDGSKVKILPLGNSITYDQMRAEFRYAQNKISYRSKLWDLLRTENFNTDFIGHKLGGYYQFPDPENCGIPGIRDDELYYLLNSGYDLITQTQVTPDNYLDSYPPDVVLLHIGINGISENILGNDTLGTNPNDVADILSLIKSSNPNIWVILALIMDGAPNIPNVTLFNNNIKKMAQTRINAGDKYLILDMQNDAGIVYLQDKVAPHDTGDMYDSVHPNDSGKEKMANLWFQAFEIDS